MLFSQIATLFASAAIVSAKPFFGLERRADQPSETSAQGYVGVPTTLSNTYPNGYISSSTFWIGSSCKGTVCKTTTTQLYASSTCTKCAHYITSGVTTDNEGDFVTYTGDVFITTNRGGAPVTSSRVTTLPKSVVHSTTPVSTLVTSESQVVSSSAWSNNTISLAESLTSKPHIVTVTVTTPWPTKKETTKWTTVTVTTPWPTKN